MIDTQQQYIKLNIRSEISIIVVHLKKGGGGGYYNLCGIRSKHSNISKKRGITICVVLDQNHGNVMFYQLVSNLQSMFPS
jgi:hypothetical protein